MANEPSASAPAAGSAPKTGDYAMGSTDRDAACLATDPQWVGSRYISAWAHEP